LCHPLMLIDNMFLCFDIFAFLPPKRSAAFCFPYHGWQVILLPINLKRPCLINGKKAPPQPFMLQITNARVVDFYARNPSVDFETANLVLVDLLERLGSSSAPTNTSNVLDEVRSVKRDVGAALNEANRGFLETVKMLLTVNAADASDRAAALLDRHMATFADRLQILLPKLTDEGSKKVGDQIGLLQRALQLDLQQVSGRDGAMSHFLESFDRRLAAVQQPLVTLLMANGDGVSQRIQALNEEVRAARGAQDKLSGDLALFLQKHNGGSPQFKGKHSEDLLSNLLCELYPTASVQNCTALTASGDFLLVRGGGLPKVMLENKNYQRNVEQEEVDKFLRDAAAQRCSAVMISQFSGIVSKPNFFIEVNDGHVLVYLHNVQYAKDLIRLAVDVVDHLEPRLQAQGEAAAATLSKEALDGINAEVQAFAKKKEALAASVRESSRALLAQLDELHLPLLFKLLSDTYTSPQTQAYVCGVCNGAFTTRRGLSLHKRSHKDGA